MAKITDPDLIVRATSLDNLGVDGNVFIDGEQLKVYLGKYGDLSDDGVSILALYQYLKEEWNSDDELIKLLFPMESITTEQFEFIDGWTYGSVDTLNLLRDGGFAVQSKDGYEEVTYVGIITLGKVGETDQIYYQQELDGVAKNIVLPGAVNQVVRVKAQVNSDSTQIDGTNMTITLDKTAKYFDVGDTITISGTASNNVICKITAIADNVVTVDGGLVDESIDTTVSIVVDYRGYFKVFVREQAKTYAQATQSDIGVLQFDYKAERFPINNSDDLKISVPDSGIDSDSDGIADVAPYNDISIHYYDTAQTYNIGGTDYQFDIVIRTSSNPTAEQIYEYVAWALRQDSNINAEAGTVIGKTADKLLTFVGDTLITSAGVYIDGFNRDDINRLKFNTIDGTEVMYPFVASGKIVFSDTLVSDQNSLYKVFFEDANGNKFGSSSAIVVNDVDGNPINGAVTDYTIPFTFDYENNTQGGRTPNTDANIVCVGIGLDNAKYVLARGTITRSSANSISLVSALERNYVNK